MDYGVARPSWPEDAESRAARLAALPRELAAEMEELMRYPARIGRPTHGYLGDRLQHRGDREEELLSEVVDWEGGQPGP